MGKGIWIFRGALGAAAMVCASLPIQARASCAPRDAALEWSYPSLDGGEVPAGGALWLIGSVGGVDAVWLDGAPLQRDRPDRVAPWMLGDATPGEHELEVRIEPIGFRGGEPTIVSGTIVVTSPTGPPGELELGDVLGVPTVELISADDVPWPWGCWDVLNAWDCYDTGQDTFAVLHAETTREPVAWRVEWTRYFGQQAIVVPADCGPPRVFLNPGESDETCFVLTPLFPEGEGRSSEPTCVLRPEPEADAGFDSSDGVDADVGAELDSTDAEGDASSDETRPDRAAGCAVAGTVRQLPSGGANARAESRYGGVLVILAAAFACARRRPARPVSLPPTSR